MGFKSATPGLNYGNLNKQYALGQSSNAKQLADAQNQVKTLNDLYTNRPGYVSLTQTDAEKNAGVMPPGFEGTRDSRTGQLLDQYKIDPFSGQASQKLYQEAMGTGPSEWAKSALGQQGFEEQQARGNAALQGQQAQSQAQSQLARLGGLGGGARTSLARSGARDQLMAAQGVGAQGIESRYGINQQDMQRRQGLLGTSADVERQAQLQNLGTTMQDVTGRAAFDANRYNQQMQAYGAKEQARATEYAGARSGGGGGCCFIFLEARYGNGVMDKVVRRYRDEHMTEQNKRGYYKVAEVLVPMMRKSRLVKLAVRLLMTDPLVAYGKAYYGEGSKLGFMFAPVKNFWLGTFHYLGGEHEFIRENGETV